MDLKLAGKTALITGGSKGIGRATAEIFAAEGCNVIIVSRSAETLAAAKSAIAQKSNVRVDTVAADLSDSKNVDRLAQDFPDIDILVNNAGAIPGGTLLDVGEATWRKAWDLKVFGYVNMCRALLRADEGAQGRRHRQRGRQRGRHARSGIYLRRRRQCGAHRVHAVARLRQREGRHPRRRAQSRAGRDRPHRHPDEEEGEGPHRQTRTTGRSCASRCRSSAARRPEEIGAATAFLASPHSGYTSGSVVTIDAGLSARATAF